MSKDKISDYSTTANSNTDIGGINVDEGCAPSGINDAIRTLMAQLKTWQSGGQDVYIHPAGSASAPSITANGDTNTGIFFPAADTVAVSTGGTERARVDSSGNLGLGVTPSALTAGKAFEVGAAGNSILGWGASEMSLLTGAVFNGGFKWAATNSLGATNYYQYNGTHVWSYAAPASHTAGNSVTFTQAMTLGSDGDLLIGATSAVSVERLTLQNPAGNASFMLATDGTGQYYAGVLSDSTSFSGSRTNHAYRLYTNDTERARIDSSGRLLVGYNSAGGVGYTTGSVGAVGYITKKGTANGLNSSGNTFNISWADGLTGAHVWIDTSDLGQITFVSDYRIKKNVVTQTVPAIDRVMQLRPITYEFADYKNLFNADGIQREGFIAHEVQEVIPSGAEGEKDAENCIQSLRLDAILSVAVKAIQEQQAIITQLQADVAALKG